MISGQVPVRQMLVYDTWAARDLPVLDATVGLLERSYMVTVTDIAAQTGLDPSVVAQALEALDPVYVDFRKTTTGGDPRFWYVFKVTPEARRAVGQWPTAEALASRLAEELAAAAQQEADGERQGLLAYAARLVGDTLRDATVRAAGAVLAPAFGGIPLPERGQPLPPPQPQEEPEFASLVQLPELPELLRPDRTADRDPAPGQDRTARQEQKEGQDQAEGEDQAAGQDRAAAATPAEPAPEPEPAAVVPDLNPWPERPGVAEPQAAAQESGQLPDASPFPSSSVSSQSAGPAAAAQDDSDSAATDLDLVQSRGDAANAR
jgi:hypothetical protein